MSGKRLLDNLDLPTIVTTFLLVGVGVFAIASATLEQPAREGLWRAQLVWFLLATVAAIVVRTGR